jgi:hypothetical protein
MWINKTSQHEPKLNTFMFGMSTDKKYADLGRVGVYTTFKK